ncbi:MAG: hypothetical protein H6559_06580 [Lewinellaceae bacterium]|nr:hypothetical protein [Lewinellaceae bacterium]
MLMVCPSTPGGNSAGFTLTDAEDPDAPSNGGSIFDINIDVDGDGSPGTTAPSASATTPSAPDAQNGLNEITDVPFHSTSTVIYARVENTNTGCAQVIPHPAGGQRLARSTGSGGRGNVPGRRRQPAADGELHGTAQYH